MQKFKFSTLLLKYNIRIFVFMSFLGFYLFAYFYSASVYPIQTPYCMALFLSFDLKVIYLLFVLLLNNFNFKKCTNNYIQNFKMSLSFPL